MKFIVNSSTPLGFSGYSVVNGNLIPRLNDISHHEFIYFTRSGRYSSVPEDYRGVPVISPPDTSGLPERYLPPLIEHHNADMVFHIMDAWILDQHMDGLRFPQIGYCPIDCSPLSPRWYTVVKNLFYSAIPYNEFGERQLKEAGLKNVRDPIYHGVDVDTYYPRPEAEVLQFDVEDPFIAGIFKANVGTRANYDHTLEAIKIFLDNNPDAKKDFRLYLHTAKTGHQGYNIEALLNFFQLSDYAKFPNQIQYSYGEISPDVLAQIYSNIDLCINTTRAEGHGLPIHESLACGTPSLISNGSAMKDVFDEGVLKADVITKEGGAGEEDAIEMRPRKMSFYSFPKVNDIADKLEYAYNHPDKLKSLGKKGKKWAHQYDWDTIATEFLDVLNDIEDELLFDEEDLLEELDEDLEI